MSETGGEFINAAMPVVAHQETAMVADAITSTTARDHLESGLRRLLIAHES